MMRGLFSSLRRSHTSSVPDFGAGHGVHKDQAGFGGMQRADDLADEILIARRVEQVDVIAADPRAQRG